jgi:hypothetical protein
VARAGGSTIQIDHLPDVGKMVTHGVETLHAVFGVLGVPIIVLTSTK